MKKYRVWARSIDYCFLDVEAESEKEAMEIAQNTDGGEFFTTLLGEWEFDKVEER